jgi:hypothetical protein
LSPNVSTPSPFSGAALLASPAVCDGRQGDEAALTSKSGTETRNPTADD